MILGWAKSARVCDLTRRDAIVIGGGPAGCAFAIELARNGLDVLLIEKTGGPHHKVCGDFLSGDTLALLKYLQVDALALGAIPTGDLRIVSGNRSRTTRLPFAAAALSRYRLDERLLQKAIDCGANVIRGDTARGIREAEYGVEIRTGAEKHLARFAAVATGKHAMPGVKHPRSNLVGFKQVLDLDPARAGAGHGTVMLSVYKRGYQGLQMIGETRAAACWIVDRASAKTLGADWSRHRAFLANQSRHVGHLLAGSKPTTARPLAIAGMPFGHLRRRAFSERIFMIGDQLGSIPSCAGDGIAIALGSGILAARAILEGQDASRFHKDMHRSLKRQFRLARPAHALLTRTAGQAVAMALLALFPGLMRTIASATRFEAGVRIVQDGARPGTQDAAAMEPNTNGSNRPGLH